MYVTKSFLSSKLFSFLFLNVLVETKSLAFYDALPRHRKRFKNKVGLTESHSIFLFFLSSFSCGMVWVEEQKKNACKFNFSLIS